MDQERTPVKEWLHTTWRLLVRPGEFFERMEPAGGLGPPLTFLAVCSAVSAVLSAAYAYQNPWFAAFSRFTNGFLTPFVLALLLYPVTLFLCRDAFTLRGLLKISAYAQVTLLFSWIPGIGWVAGLWRFYLIGNGQGGVSWSAAGFSRTGSQPFRGMKRARQSGPCLYKQYGLLAASLKGALEKTPLLSHGKTYFARSTERPLALVGP
jgi:hypothetical protein